ncbi:MAG: hypothetical protein IJE84_00015, partial [Clostridia bacterium]|nr:hypothetical protein [Clostridia bacterium]
INGGNFANIMLLNRRFDAKAPMGTYSGNMTVNFNGGKITGKASEATMRSGALSMCYLAGNMTVNFNGMEVEDGHVFYAVTRTATLSGIEKDNSLNTGSLTVNGDAITLDKYIRENMRTNDNDGQMATIENLSINCASTVGDLDFDGSISNSDITALVRYLSGWTVDGAKYTGDFTADNKVNNRDVIALIQKLNAGN